MSHLLFLCVGCCWAGVALAVSPGEPVRKAFDEVNSLKPLLVGVFALITIYGGMKWAFSDEPRDVQRGKRIVMGAVALGFGLLFMQQFGAPLSEAITKFLDGGLLGVGG